MGLLESSTESRRYQGMFENGIPHGRGLFEDLNGCVYDGDFVGGIKTGKGTIKWIDGSSYTGTFMSDEVQQHHRHSIQSESH